MRCLKSREECRDGPKDVVLPVGPRAAQVERPRAASRGKEGSEEPAVVREGR